MGSWMDLMDLMEPLGKITTMHLANVLEGDQTNLSVLLCADGKRRHIPSKATLAEHGIIKVHGRPQLPALLPEGEL